MESNEAEVVAILEGMRLFDFSSLQSKLIVESHSLNAISWVTPFCNFLEDFNSVLMKSELCRRSLKWDFIMLGGRPMVSLIC